MRKRDNIHTNQSPLSGKLGENFIQKKLNASKHAWTRMMFMCNTLEMTFTSFSAVYLWGTVL